jgi:DNA-binding transcriptional regulator GbsR (MarR family)
MNSLPPLTQQFILHWGEMGTRWGINRTVAQVHALLFLSEKPISAEEIAMTLGIARSNTSTSLRELQNWGIVRVIHLPGDRRDHFTSVQDVYAMFRAIARQRKKREIDPTVHALQELLTETDKPKSTETNVRRRVSELLEFFELLGAAYNRLEKLPTPAVLKLVKMGDKALRLTGIAK